MLRVRLKADGRLVEVLPDGGERPISFSDGQPVPRANGGASSANGRFDDAAYARNVRGQTGLTQIAFAAQIGVPVETVRNWEQGRSEPDMAARNFLGTIARDPDAVRRALVSEQ